jgi:hypothetical protein
MVKLRVIDNLTPMNITLKGYVVTEESTVGYTIQGQRGAEYLLPKNPNGTLSVMQWGKATNRMGGYRIFTDKNGVIEPIK